MSELLWAAVTLLNGALFVITYRLATSTSSRIDEWRALADEIARPERFSGQSGTTIPFVDNDYVVMSRSWNHASGVYLIQLQDVTSVTRQRVQP